MTNYNNLVGKKIQITGVPVRANISEFIIAEDFVKEVTKDGYIIFENLNQKYNWHDFGMCIKVKVIE